MSTPQSALSCRGLAAGYNGSAVLQNINLDIEHGCLTTIIGPNGSGKSTLLRVLAGLARPLAGEICYNGASLADMNARQLAKCRAFVSTWRNGGGALTVAEAVSTGRSMNAGLFGKLGKDDRRSVDQAMQAVGVDRFANRYMGTLSDGEKQKVMIARALAQDTDIMILDEPTAFLDVAARIDTLALLRRLADNGRTVIFSTHDIAPAFARTDRVICVKRPTVLCGTVESLSNDGTLGATFPTLTYNPDILDYR